jgi:hypothetical protein
MDLLENTTLGRYAQRSLIAIALVVLLLHFCIYVYYSLSLLHFPFDYDQGEGFELVDTLYLSEGKSPYRSNDTYPFYASNYPPLYHVILIPFAWIFGAEYWYGRLVAFLGTLVTAAAIAYGVYRGERQQDIALLMGLAFLASNYIYHIGPLFRQHYFMVMLETLAVVTLATMFDLPDRKSQDRRLIWGLFLLLLAGYTKQLAMFTCIAVFAWLFIRHPRRAILAGIGFGLAAGVVFLILNILTGGEWYTNVIAANVNQFIPSQFTGLARQFIRLHWTLLLMAGLLAAYELYFARLSLYSVWFVVTLASTVGSGKWGAGDSYFASGLAATVILAGIFISRTLNRSWVFPENYLSRAVQRMRINPSANILYPIGQIICLVLVIVYGFTVIKIPTSGAVFEPLSEALGIAPKPGHRYPLYDAAGWTPGYATIGHLPSQADIDAGWQIVERIRATDKPVLSEEAGFSLQAGRDAITNPTQLKNLYDNDLLDPSELVAMIEDHGFGMIIFRARFYPDPILAAVDDAYYPKEVIPMNGFQYELWYPEPTWEIRRQIRNYLEGVPDTRLEVQLPESVNDPNQWMLDMMSRWAWLPKLELEPSPASKCLSRAFVRRGFRTILTLCDTLLTVMPPVRNG